MVQMQLHSLLAKSIAPEEHCPAALNHPEPRKGNRPLHHVSTKLHCICFWTAITLNINGPRNQLVKLKANALPVNTREHDKG